MPLALVWTEATCQEAWEEQTQHRRGMLPATRHPRSVIALKVPSLYQSNKFGKSVLNNSCVLHFRLCCCVQGHIGQQPLDAVPSFGGSTSSTAEGSYRLWDPSKVPTPRKIVAALDKFIVGQEATKKVRTITAPAWLHALSLNAPWCALQFQSSAETLSEIYKGSKGGLQRC